MPKRPNTYLGIYAVVLTAAFASLLLMGAKSAPRNADFDQITVHRINVVEPDGTPRMVISDAAEGGTTYLHGKEIPRPDRKVAGIMFINNEGTENGGLVYDGSSKDGKASSHGHLSFDNYDQDQTVVLEANQDNTSQKSSFLQINDQPNWDVKDFFALQDANRGRSAQDRKSALQAFLKTHPTGEPRVYLGTRIDHSSDLVLKDPQGHPRIEVKVAANGDPSLQFLDANGRVIEQLPQSAAH